MGFFCFVYLIFEIAEIDFLLYKEVQRGEKFALHTIQMVAAQALLAWSKSFALTADDFMSTAHPALTSH